MTALPRLPSLTPPPARSLTPPALPSLIPCCLRRLPACLPTLLQEDAGAFGEAFLDANRYAQQRLSNVADTWQGRELDPSRILGRQRHGEWFQSQPVQGGRARCDFCSFLFLSFSFFGWLPN